MQRFNYRLKTVLTVKLKLRTYWWFNTGSVSEEIKKKKQKEVEIFPIHIVFISGAQNYSYAFSNHLDYSCSRFIKLEQLLKINKIKKESMPSSFWGSIRQWNHTRTNKNSSPITQHNLIKCIINWLTSIQEGMPLKKLKWKWAENN